MSSPAASLPSLVGTIRRESWRHSGTTTTAIACIARSRGSRQRSAPAHSVPLLLHWITTVGGGTAKACLSSRSLPDYDFATDRHDTRSLQHYLGHKNIAHTVRYTELAPDRFKGFWKD